MPTALPILTIANAAAWAAWLSNHAEKSSGVWLSLAKKGTTSPTSLTYPQAVDEALCHGWIDSQTRKLDEKTFAQRFTPRKAKSSWSQINVGHVARLEREGRMTVLGRKAVAAAKADGRWDAAYAGPATAEAPADFLAAVALVPKAQAMWEALTKQNRFVIYMRLATLKTQSGREQRIAAFVDMLARGETPLVQKETVKQESSAAKRVSKVDKKHKGGSEGTGAKRKANASTKTKVGKAGSATKRAA